PKGGGPRGEPARAGDSPCVPARCRRPLSQVDGQAGSQGLPSSRSPQKTNQAALNSLLNSPTRAGLKLYRRARAHLLSSVIMSAINLRSRSLRVSSQRGKINPESSALGRRRDRVVVQTLLEGIHAALAAYGREEVFVTAARRSGQGLDAETVPVHCYRA